MYDKFFVNEDVFFGDVVANEHLKNQYSMVVGEEGGHHLARYGASAQAGPKPARVSTVSR